MKKPRLCIIVIVLIMICSICAVGFVGCDKESEKLPELNYIESMIVMYISMHLDSFKDPASVRISRAGWTDGGRYFAEISAKNSFGGYVSSVYLVNDKSGLYSLEDKSSDDDSTKFAKALYRQMAETAFSESDLNIYNMNVVLNQRKKTHGYA